ncbi:hypothetical protein F5Y07DRAFT_384764 [Xylaria sp. FL0933]|nr:hypothetical protein F5Y07DRAFT_384764 [Xylaria sp. FL0933]
MDTAQGFPMAASFAQESSTDSSEPGTQPATPEPELCSTPNTTPERPRTGSDRHKQVSVQLDGQRHSNPGTTQIVSSSSAHKIPSHTNQFQQSAPCETNIATTCNSNWSFQSAVYQQTEEVVVPDTDKSSRHSTHSEISEKTTSSAVISDHEETHSSLSVVGLIYRSFVAIINLAKERKSRADNARVQSIIKLLNSTPKIERTGGRNITRKLSNKQYKQLLRILEDPGDHSLLAGVKDSLRFEYSHSKKLFEVRMTTPLHAGVQGLFAQSVGQWRGELVGLNDSRISEVVKTIDLTISERLDFPCGTEGEEAKAADAEIQHQCDRSVDRQCRYPTLVFEVGWTQSRKELQEKAETYVNYSNGEIRTIIAIHMQNMYVAEVKNESRLRRMYRKGEVDETGSYSYLTDENNKTGSASILTWRARRMPDGTVRIGNPCETVFRDSQGNPIQSAPLRIPLKDMLCADIVDSQRGIAKASPLEISADLLHEMIERKLQVYRKRRALKIKKGIEEEKRRKSKKIEKEEERLRAATEVRRREAGDGPSGNEGLVGRVFRGPRLLSARIMGKQKEG